MPWWLVVAGLVIAVLAGWSAISWLLGEADAGTLRAQARIDAIRTGLTVIAGTGGAVGLVLAARRQWLSERALQPDPLPTRRVTSTYRSSALGA
jgi:hypothetical protein